MVEAQYKAVARALRAATAIDPSAASPPEGASDGRVLPTLLLILAGVLVGGTWSLHKQGAPRRTW